VFITSAKLTTNDNINKIYIKYPLHFALREGLGLNNPINYKCTSVPSILRSSRPNFLIPDDTVDVAFKGLSRVEYAI
jgi:hypothetical protein